MPRDNDKDNDSRGRRDRPSGGKGRSGVARGPEKKFAKRGFGGKTEGERRPYAGNAKIARRAARTAMRRARVVTGRLPIGRREAARAKSVRSGRAKTVAATSAHTRRAEIGPPIVATATTRVRPRVSRTGNSATKNPTRPREDREKRPYTPRGEGFRKDSDRPRGDRPFNARPRDGDRPRGIAPKENSTATRSFRAARARISADRPDRDREFARDRSEDKPWQKRDSPRRIVRSAARVPPREGARNFDRPKFDKPRYDRPRDRERRSSTFFAPAR